MSRTGSCCAPALDLARRANRHVKGALSRGPSRDEMFAYPTFPEIHSGNGSRMVDTNRKLISDPIAMNRKT